jgi:Fe-S cluster biogenesis protein NfuA
MSDAELKVLVQPTPNPQALKFIVSRPVKTDGKATFANKAEAAGVKLAEDLFDIPGISQLHFFDNFITVTFSDEFDPSQLEGAIESVLMTRMPIHDPNFATEKSKPKPRKSVSPEIDKIEEILDRTVRPGLQSDGGDIEVLDYTDHKLLVNYQGACGTCPSSAMGTLEAIRSILSYEFDPEIDVIIAPQASSFEPEPHYTGMHHEHVESGDNA